MADELEKKKKKLRAIDFLNCVRGNYIMSQALTIAIETMKKVPHPYREESNISDMEYLRDELFSIYKVIHEADKQIMKLKGETGGIKNGKKEKRPKKH